MIVRLSLKLIILSLEVATTVSSFVTPAAEEEVELPPSIYVIRRAFPTVPSTLLEQPEKNTAKDVIATAKVFAILFIFSST